MSKKIHIIINPSSGKEEPILHYINRVFKDSDINWTVSITQKQGDAYVRTKEIIKKNIDIVAVYGGDGTIMEVAQALFNRSTPLCIIPGGTANVMAKELGIPENSLDALRLLTKKRIKTKAMDMGLIDKLPFALRINLGILAHMIHSTTKESKERFGTIAYTVSAFKHMVKQDIYTFKMDIDGKEIVETGVALMVANVGNIGISGFSVLPHVDIFDGYLDVIVFKTADATSVIEWAKSTVTSQKPNGSIKHWKAKKVRITFDPYHQVICDDIPLSTKSIQARVVSKALTVVIP